MERGRRKGEEGDRWRDIEREFNSNVKYNIGRSANHFGKKNICHLSEVRVATAQLHPNPIASTLYKTSRCSI